MELPYELKTLYYHWEKHTVKPAAQTNSDFNQSIYNQVLSFANERMNIWEKKILNQNPPYSNDQILTNFRFCNVYRELDKQTIVFHKLLKPLKHDLDLWLLNMIFCRFVCNPETITKVGFLNFDTKNNQEVYKKLVNLSSPKYGTAYIFPISIIQKSKWNTREKFFCEYLPIAIPDVSEIIKSFGNISVVEALSRILPAFKFNFKFHWTEVLIDLAYQFPDYIDLFKEFPIGPGSIPSMKNLNNLRNPEIVCLKLVSSVPDNFNYLTFEGKTIYLSAENWEGIGCEFRKYSNLKQGKGRKRRFRD